MTAPTYLQTSLWRPLPPKGKTPHHTMFNPADGTYCALGLYFKAQGVSDVALAECGYPSELQKRFGVQVPKPLMTVLAADIMEASDGVERPYCRRPHDRRNAITMIFHEAGIDVRWTP